MTRALPLGPSQETVWEFVRYFAPRDPGAAEFNVVEWSDWPVAVDPARFRRAVADVVARQDALRMVFVDTGVDPTVRFLPDVSVPVDWHDLSEVDPQMRRERLESLAATVPRQHFDLRSGPLWSVAAIRLGPARHIVVVCLYHLIADGMSANVLLRDLSRAYQHREGSGPPLPGLRVGFSDLMARGSPPAERAARVEHWRRRLDPLPNRFAFPARAPAPDADLTERARVEVPFGRTTEEAVIRFAATVRTTPFIALLSAYRIALAGWTGWDRIVLGTTTHGRRIPGTEDLVGQLTTNVYLATTLTPGATLHEVVGQVHEEMVLAVRHAAPFTEIARAVYPGFDAARPWPFLNLYDAWFQATAGTDRRDPEPAGHRPQHEATRRPRRSEWASELAACPEHLETWAKRGEPGFYVGGAGFDGAAFVFCPGFYPAEMVSAVAAGYPAVVDALLDDPHQRVGDLLTAQGWG